MPKRTDIHKILIIGFGPIVISQACEFDYSGTQACKALREEGYQVVLINSNPATIMTDPDMADRTDIEPMTPEAVAKIIEKERPDALLPTLGGQTALNTAVRVAEMGELERFGVQIIGARVDVIRKAEDRKLFRDAMTRIGLRVPRSGIAYSQKDVLQIAEAIGFPMIVRPAFTLGGTGGGVAYNREELVDLARAGLDASLIHQVILEESVLGWKEFELELMRDHMDNVVIICSIENMDPMGVHTGDSITVAPAQTLTDREYQKMPDATVAILREIGVETGGSDVQFGGQTPLNLAVSLERVGAPVVGTPPQAIDLAEDRTRFQHLLHSLGLKQPENGTALTAYEAAEVARRIGYPVVVRPSYVLGGRAMQIVYDELTLRRSMDVAAGVSPGHAILIDKFLEDALELDVDAVCDGESTLIGGIMEHIEAAGIHSGDSACVLPPVHLSRDVQEEVKRQTRLLAHGLGVVGLMNVQFAIQKNTIYVLEVNPRASRTVPFVSKATGGIPLAKIATKLMLGHKLRDLGFTEEREPRHVSVKESVFPFSRFSGGDTLLGPEMKSTGEVMGIDRNFGLAYAKAQMAAGYTLPLSGTVFVSVHDKDKEAVVPIARAFQNMGFSLIATAGTRAFLADHGVGAKKVHKLSEGRPHVLDYIKDRQVHFVMNTSFGPKTHSDAYRIRRATVFYTFPTPPQWLELRPWLRSWRHCARAIGTCRRCRITWKKWHRRAHDPSARHRVIGRTTDS